MKEVNNTFDFPDMFSKWAKRWSIHPQDHHGLARGFLLFTSRNYSILKTLKYVLQEGKWTHLFWILLIACPKLGFLAKLLAISPWLRVLMLMRLINFYDIGRVTYARDIVHEEASLGKLVVHCGVHSLVGACQPPFKISLQQSSLKIHYLCLNTGSFQRGIEWTARLPFSFSNL